MKSIYFPGLNALRFYAALSVVVYHGSLRILGPEAAQQTIPLLEMLTLHGDDAVTLFFSLSGFLITYLLLQERQTNGSIAVRKFYLRRILRIWPLYYWIILLSVVIVPVFFQAIEQPEKSPQTPTSWIALSLVMLPTVAFLVIRAVPTVLDQLWSIGMEEIFYLVWPHTLRKRRSFLKLSALWIISKTLIVIAASQLDRAGDGGTIWGYLTFALGYLRFEAMMIGAFAALLLFRGHKLLNALYHPIVQIGALLYFISMISIRPFSGHFSDLIFACTSAIIILNVAANPACRWRIENRWTRHLGNWSYGIYMYHTLVLFLLVQFGIRGGFWLYALAIFFTIAAAALSYQWLEKPFLRLKTQRASVDINPVGETVHAVGSIPTVP